MSEYQRPIVNGIPFSYAAFSSVQGMRTWLADQASLDQPGYIEKLKGAAKKMKLDITPDMEKVMQEWITDPLKIRRDFRIIQDQGTYS